jgi:hypothetical protein
MALKSKIERLFGVSKIDKHLLKLYNNYEGNNLNDFTEDCNVIIELQKLLKKIISGYEVNMQLLSNKYILLKNIFGIQGLVYIAVNYFSENEKLFEYFCSLVYYLDEVQISNRLNSSFLEFLKEKIE